MWGSFSHAALGCHYSYSLSRRKENDLWVDMNTKPRSILKRRVSRL